MSWTTPLTWVTGSVVTAAQMNTYVSNNLSFLYGGGAGNRPIVRLGYTTTAQSIPTNASTAAVYNNVLEDTSSGYSAGIYTIPLGGLWSWSAFSGWAGNGTGYRALSVQQNNLEIAATFVLASTDPGSAGRTTASVQARMTAGDTVKCVITQTSGGALNFGQPATLTGVWISG